MNIYFTNLKCNIANFNQIYTFISLVQKCVCVCLREREISNYKYCLYQYIRRVLYNCREVHLHGIHVLNFALLNCPIVSKYQ